MLLDRRILSQLAAPAVALRALDDDLPAIVQLNLFLPVEITESKQPCSRIQARQRQKQDKYAKHRFGGPTSEITGLRGFLRSSGGLMGWA